MEINRISMHVPVSYEMAVDCGMMTEDEARAHGWIPAPKPRWSRWRQARWSWAAKRERFGRRVGGWIAGVSLADELEEL